MAQRFDQEHDLELRRQLVLDGTVLIRKPARG
jgi:hypothetical protein